MIRSELSQELNHFWFSKKEKKFLHNIDSFYYSIKLSNDFTCDSQDDSCLFLRSFFRKIKERMTHDSYCPLIIPGLDVTLNVRPFKFDQFYNINIECPELFDIFIADTVPPGANGTESVTSEIIVQLRSYLLWQNGVTKAFEYSYDIVKAICEHFNLDILEVKENRVDYCWHSNYLQNPEKYFRIDNMNEMQVSQFSRIRYDYDFKANREYENDYIFLGRRTSNKCFLRIYLKTKEVVQQGYKSWFFKEWLFNGLISRYDNYVLEKAFIKKLWNYVDKARLEFYLEYGTNELYKNECAAILSGDIIKNTDYISKLADKLTPRVTMIINVEYQTHRKFSKSFNFIQFRNNRVKYDAACERIYDYIDNRRLIIDYLTSKTFRLVVPDPNETNRSRLEDNAFWKALKACRIIDVKKAPKDIKLVRDYSSKLNKERVKNTILSSMATYSLYEKGVDNEDSAFADSADFISSLNDNDIYKFRQHKFKKSKLLNKKLDYGSPGASRNYIIIDADTGEILGGCPDDSNTC